MKESGRIPAVHGPRKWQSSSSANAWGQAAWDKVVPTPVPTSIPTPVDHTEKSVVAAGIASKQGFGGSPADLAEGPSDLTFSPVNLPGRIGLLSGKALSNVPIFSQAYTSSAFLTPNSKPHLSSAISPERGVHDISVAGAPVLQAMSLSVSNLSSEPIFPQVSTSSASPIPHSDCRPSPAAPVERNASADSAFGNPIPQAVPMNTSNLKSEPEFSPAPASSGQTHVEQSKLKLTEAEVVSHEKVCCAAWL